MDVSSTDCPVGMVGTPDFGKAAVGPTNVVHLVGGKSARATVPLTINNASFTTFNAKAPTRCTLTLTASVPGSIDPTPENAVVTVEISIVDKNDPQGPTAHESLIKSIAPVRVLLSDGMTTKSKNAKPAVINADILPMVETTPDAITVIASNGDCPSGTVGVADYNQTPGAKNVAQVSGGKVKGGVLPLTINPSTFFSPNKKSPARCTAVLTATGPGGDSDGSNNTTKLVIDVIDANDF